MTFGIIHYAYLTEALLMTACVLLLVRRFVSQKNRMTLVFTFFILGYALLCFLYFGRGFFDQGVDGSILMYRSGMVVSAVIPAILAVFMIYPMVAAQGGLSNAKPLAFLLLVLWLMAVVAAFLLIIGTVGFSFSFNDFDVYSTTFAPLSYTAIVAIPISVAVVDALAMALMYMRETEAFFRMRALLLLVGWVVVLSGQVMLLSATTLVLNPVLITSGTLLMAAAILRRKPS